MTDFELSRLLLSLVLLLAMSLGLGQVFETLGLPRVIGEILAGILLGPSLMGAIAPDIYRWVFDAYPEQGKLLSVFYWLGLIFLMFTAGFRISTTFEKSVLLHVGALVLGGICLPFFFGFFTASYFPNGAQPNPMAFSLVIATGAAVTSIPVISKIYMDLGIEKGSFSRITLTAAAIQDLLLWMVLSVAISIQQGGGVSYRELATIVSATIGFSVFAVFVAPVFVRQTGRMVVGRSPEEALLGYTLLVCLILVSLASIMRVNIVFGALLAGLVVGKFSAASMGKVKQSISSVSIWFFVPIYFALVGLKMNLHAHFDFRIFAGFLLASTFLKIVSVTFMARLSGFGVLPSFDFGVAMNARGGPGIVLASLAFAAAIIDERWFVGLVMTSIVTSLIAGIWLKWRKDIDPGRFA